MAKRKRYSQEEGMVLWDFLASRKREALQGIETTKAMIECPGGDAGNLPGQLKYYQQVAGYLQRCLYIVRMQTAWADPVPSPNEDITIDPS